MEHREIDSFLTYRLICCFLTLHNYPSQKSLIVIKIKIDLRNSDQTLCLSGNHKLTTQNSHVCLQCAGKRSPFIGKDSKNHVTINSLFKIHHYRYLNSGRTC